MKPSPHADHIKIGDRIIVTVKRLGINGEGVGYYRRKAVFIDGALPNEVIKADVTRVEANVLYANMTAREKTSPQRVESPCPVFRTEQCGGCQLQHLEYTGQLQAKTELVREAFARYCELDNPPIREIRGMDEPWRYRNKAQFPLGLTKDGTVIAGLYSSRDRRLLDLLDCPIQPAAINRVVRDFVDCVQALNIPIYEEKSRRGVLRSLVVREGYNGDLQVTIVSAGANIPDIQTLIRTMTAKHANIITIAQNINSSATPLIFGERTHILYGTEKMDMRLGSFKFAVSPRAFFQLNNRQTEVLYEEVRQAAALTGNESVIDAYCGSGTIGLWLAPFARDVRGMDVIREAVEDARHNARLNKIGNASFHVGKAEELLPQWLKLGLSADVVVVDPPRTGCDRKLLHAVVTTNVKKLIYVSCNPATLAKDCRFLLENGYTTDYIQPVDMFPHTSHVECVAVLKKTI